MTATRTDDTVAADLAELAELRAALGPTGLADLLARHRSCVATRTVGAELAIRGAMTGTVIADRNGLQWRKTDSLYGDTWFRWTGGRPGAGDIVTIGFLTISDTTAKDYTGPYVVVSVPDDRDDR